MSSLPQNHKIRNFSIFTMFSFHSPDSSTDMSIFCLLPSADPSHHLHHHRQRQEAVAAAAAIDPLILIYERAIN
ncbi:hypothetical protein L596_025785 [Steinernema carpocapsae]|uniref:Uncharacterized protein n=1 Tax=Steinernema carpocapsae TaxID=34508 RepID=A0A4U5M8W6_STECR|nr:hypothetical protein L596_025785 [Steinernema carpocapsae]